VSKKKVLLAMSGGLDSSIAAMLLLEQGYELVGATFRTWDYISESCLNKNTGCCSIEAIGDAAAFAESLGFSHHVLDLRNEFRNVVISNFVKSYVGGTTPNPCVICNAYIKWGLMLDFAHNQGCDFIATGHYAGIRQYGDRFVLINAVDNAKDQTYFLWQLTSEQLSKTLFPLHGLSKEKVRKIAFDEGLVSLSKKRESQEICFIPDNNYSGFIQKEFSTEVKDIGNGDVLDASGKIIGKHKGYFNYTIGQRKGLGVAVGRPVYVTAIDSFRNTITIGDKEDLLTQEIMVEDMNLNKFEEIPNEFSADVKIRYNTHRVSARIKKLKNGCVVKFDTPVSAATPGQSAVFYQGDECIGGGVICNSLK